MGVTFADLVEDLKKLSVEEKIVAKDLLDKFLIEERREEILRNYEDSRRNAANGTLKFSSDLAELEAMLDD